MGAPGKLALASLVLLFACCVATCARAAEYLVLRHELQTRPANGELERLYIIDAASLRREGDKAHVEVWVDRTSGTLGRPASQSANYDIDCRQLLFRPHDIRAYNEFGLLVNGQAGSDAFLPIEQGSVHESIARIACAPSLADPQVVERFERVDVQDRRAYAVARLFGSVTATPPRATDSPPPAVEATSSWPPSERAQATTPPAPDSETIRELTVSELLQLALPSTTAVREKNARVRVRGRLAVPTTDGLLLGSRNACWLFERPNQGGGAHVQLEFADGDGPNTMRTLPGLFRATDLAITTDDGRKVGHGAFVVVEGVLAGHAGIRVTSIRRAPVTGVRRPAPIPFRSGGPQELHGEYVSVTGRLDYSHMSSVGEAMYEFRLNSPTFGPGKSLFVRLNVGTGSNQIAAIPSVGIYFESSLRIRDGRGELVPIDAQLRFTGVLDRDSDADGTLGRLYAERIERTQPPPASRRPARAPVARPATRPAPPAVNRRPPPPVEEARRASGGSRQR